MTLYVGNLAFRTTDESLASLFAPFGHIISARIVVDRETARHRGFGFVEFADVASAQRAIDELSGTMHLGRTLIVNRARDRASKPSFAPVR